MTAPRNAFCDNCNLRHFLCKGSCSGKSKSELAAEVMKRELWLWVAETRRAIRRLLSGQ